MRNLRTVALADRLPVPHEGRIVAELAKCELDIEAPGRGMGGGAS